MLGIVQKMAFCHPRQGRLRSIRACKEKLFILNIQSRAWEIFISMRNIKNSCF